MVRRGSADRDRECTEVMNWIFCCMPFDSSIDRLFFHSDSFTRASHSSIFASTFLPRTFFSSAKNRNWSTIFMRR